jgi:pseudaminic acid biosynthesis-associated methylase
MDNITEQELFWKGEFGDQYVDRMRGDDFVASNIAMFSDVFRSVTDVSSIIEFGANIGLNLRAIHALLPSADLCGIEINSKAAQALREWGVANVIESSIYNIDNVDKADFSLIKGVMIHLNPDKLKGVYSALYKHSKKYICIAEYYNPVPVEIEYHGHNERMYKRDFAGEFMDMFPDVELVDYGVTYKRDPLYRHDDLNWYLLKKKDK